ncbi:AAA-like domain-containing protein [Hyalangium rubrum]|uniref:AAA-like domain-containing protein n=1 Tax=Hyalangium rubrum TaxID=3103134 RepID=A0ABU5HGM8_9BACT|nr:AAA-like domain-containing protein [Hyalangium sp. s54d21]MDY7232396.1 AAA-like domain-containing protein [Hyalangium sp. s54d21]
MKVTCEDGSVGTGYFVTPDKVVTCEHVVRRVKKDGQVLLSLADGSSHPAHLERVDASTDVALLRLPQGAPSLTPLRVMAEVARNRPFALVGFPKTMGGNPLLLQGVVHDPVGRDKRGASALVLYSDMVAAGRGALMHGYSGSPVVVDGAVVGHLGRVLIEGDAERPAAELGLVFATPGREVLRFLQGEVPAPVAALPAQAPGAAYSQEWYVPRPECERLALAYLERPGSPAVLYGPRQSGKSWLLDHLVSAWRQKWPKGSVARINLLEFDGLASLTELTDQLAYTLMEELNGDESWLATHETGKGRASEMMRLGTMLKKHALGGGNPVLLAIDSTDAILGRAYAGSFFGGLRSWMQKSSPPWDQLRLLMAVSTTPSRIIQDTNQSPFNLSDPVVLPPLSQEDVGQLTQRHGLQLQATQLEGLYALAGGHPYLVRRALFAAAMASGGRGALPLEPTSEVFEAYLLSLGHFVEREKLGPVLKAVLRDPTTAVSPAQEDLLKKAWLVRRTVDGGLEPTCTLHREFFARVLGRSASQ